MTNKSDSLKILVTIIALLKQKLRLVDGKAYHKFTVTEIREWSFHQTSRDHKGVGVAHEITSLKK